eukprot:Opistho-2@24476
MKWYRADTGGQCPSGRAGASANEYKGRMIVYGGADPDGVHTEAYALDIATYKWLQLKTSGDKPKPRYEHCACVNATTGELFVFGGADMESRFADLSILNLDSLVWSVPSFEGAPPSPRTYHTCTAMVGSKLYVFSGGENGAFAVTDADVHVFDTVSKVWTVATTNGRAPSPRFGHVIAAVGTRLFVHGGMNGAEIFGDLHILDTETLTWSSPTSKGNAPRRTGHACVVIGSKVYVQGGLHFGGDGPSPRDDLFALDTETLSWEASIVDTEKPSARLDHVMCRVSKADGTADVILFGGMDDTAEFYGDCHVLTED